jgi:hypothetical protein
VKCGRKKFQNENRKTRSDNEVWEGKMTKKGRQRSLVMEYVYIIWVDPRGGADLRSYGKKCWALSADTKSL